MKSSIYTNRVTLERNHKVISVLSSQLYHIKPCLFFAESWKGQRRLHSKQSHRQTTFTSPRTPLSQRNFSEQTGRKLRIKVSGWLMRTRRGTGWRSRENPVSLPHKKEQKDSLLTPSMVSLRRTQSQPWSKWLFHRSRTEMLSFREVLFQGQILESKFRGKMRWLRWNSGSKFTKGRRQRGQSFWVNRHFLISVEWIKMISSCGFVSLWWKKNCSCFICLEMSYDLIRLTLINISTFNMILWI